MEARESSDAGGSGRVRGVRRSPRTRKKVEKSSTGKERGLGEASPTGTEEGGTQGGTGKEGNALGESARDDVLEADSAMRNISVGEGEEREDPVAPASETVVRRGGELANPRR